MMMLCGVEVPYVGFQFLKLLSVNIVFLQYRGWKFNARVMKSYILLLFDNIVYV